MKKVTIKEVGTMAGYEEYHNEYYCDGKKIGSSDYNKEQKLHVGSLEGTRKNLYGKTPQGIAFKMEKIINL